MGLVNDQDVLIHAFASEVNDAISIDFENLTNALPKIYNEYFHKMLYNVLHNERLLTAIAEKSYTHQNGFDKFQVYTDLNGWSLRIHIWDRELRSDAPIDTNTHSHRWSYISRIICGEIEETLYKKGLTGKEMEEYQYYLDAGDVSKYSLQGISHLEIATIRSFQTGDVYYISSDQIHFVRPLSSYAATFFVQGVPSKTASNIYATESLVNLNDLNERKYFSTEVAKRKLAQLISKA